MISAQQLYPIQSADPLDRSTHGLRQLLGWLGIVIPPLCVAWSALFPTTVVDAGVEVLISDLTSVSAYYYTSGVWAFVGILVGMGLFLFTYKGYGDAGSGWDFWISTLCGVAAIGIAVFPTAPPHDALRLPWWSPWMSVAHGISAVTLFLLFLVFCWLLFPGKDWRVSEEERKKREWQRLSRTERIRKYPVYYGCGLLILVCLIWAGVSKLRGGPIFWQEWFALWFFGIAWLRKGQVQWTLKEGALTRPLVVGIEGTGRYVRDVLSRQKPQVGG